jgi:hypothetical protein
LVSAATTPVVVTLATGGVFEDYAGRIGGPVESVPYPRQYGPRPGLVLLLDDNGIYKPTPYNRWGIVGTFAVTRLDRRGSWLSLGDRHIEVVLADLADADGGCLDPASGMLNAFREPFARCGIPPAGWVPPAGRWFE